MLIDNIGMRFKARSPVAVVIVSSLWLATVCNLPWWQALFKLPQLEGWHGVWSSILIAIMIAGAITSLLGVWVWRWTLKPIISVLIVVASLSTYYMLQYGIYIDTHMIVNLMQTDAKEMSDQINWRMALSVTVLCGPILFWMWSTPVLYPRTKRAVIQNGLLLVLGIAVAMGSVLVNSQEFISLMRNQTKLRFLINPLNTIYGLTNAYTQPLKRDETVQALGLDAVIDASPEHAPPLFILVLGETARSPNFSINSYNKNTNPMLSQESIVSFTQARSCGTSTASSVPCMFSNWGRAHFEKRRYDTENFLDVLQRAGYAVLWIDNQSGCKGQCGNIHQFETSNLKDPTLCKDDECFDEIMIKQLPDQIKKLPSERVQKGVVVVMHQMGSHGPAYYKRSPKAFKKFLPECSTEILSRCSQAEIVNAYDNTLVYTDYFLSQVISYLKKKSAVQPTVMLYVSDHGESLGENKLYLHGLPYAIAPDVQIHVPWITWLSPSFENQRGLTRECLNADKDQKITHDHLFHSVLGLMQVKTQVYRADLDVYKNCASAR